MAFLYIPKVILSRHHRFRWVSGLVEVVFKVKVGRWFQQLKASKHFSELQLQHVLFFKFQKLMPSYDIVYYDKDITHTLTKKNKTPDFLVWKKDYTEWIVIEVEMSNHTISHMQSQIDTFYNGDYSKVTEISSYVKKKHPGLDRAKFENMISSIDPKIMLIADKILPEWRIEFAKYNCIFATLQTYVDVEDNFVYRLNGDFPQEFTDFSYCTWIKEYVGLVVDRPEIIRSLGKVNGDVVEVYYRLNPESFEVIDSGDDTVTLQYMEDIPPMDQFQKKYKLIVNTEGQLHLIK